MNLKKDTDYLKAIDEAFVLDSEGKLDDATSLLRSIVSQIPSDDVKSLVQVGTLLRKLNVLEEALYCFKKVLETDPESERGSLGLFHSLWRLQRYNLALDELTRYVSAYGSEDHSLLLSEMAEGFFDVPIGSPFDELDLIGRIREEVHDAQ